VRKRLLVKCLTTHGCVMDAVR